MDGAVNQSEFFARTDASCYAPTRMFTTRPVLQGTFGMVSAGHYLAAQAGMRLLEAGGNAFDAAAATGFALAVLEPHLNGLGGEVPVLAHVASDRRTFAYSGQGPSPEGLALELVRGLGLDRIPGTGLLAATVPAVVDTWCALLSHHGTKSLSEILAPALELAEGGFPLETGLVEYLASQARFFHETWPSTAAVFTPEGRAPAAGTIFKQPALANTLQLLASTGREAKGRSRSTAIQYARNAFYRGPIAEPVIRFIDAANAELLALQQGRIAPDRHAGRLTLAGPGYLTRDDLADYNGRAEPPVSIEFGGLTICKCGPWSQGPVFLQQLRLLDGTDLGRLKHNSPDYLHLLTESAKLAFADREAFYGDPHHSSVPLEALLSEEYAAGRRRLIDPLRASREMRPGAPGGRQGHCPWWPPREPAGGVDPAAADPTLGARGGVSPPPPAGPGTHLGDTTHLDVVDRHGNMVSATQSGGWIHGSPIIPGLGFALGTRAQMFCMEPEHPNVVGPRKRPRTTLTPTIVLRDGRAVLGFGTPGGDGQDQWSLQFFLNHVVFGMDLQAAIDAPTVHSLHFPSSFDPHEAYPARLAAEGRIPRATLEALAARGHEVQVDGNWSHGRVCAVAFDPATGLVSGAASPRRGTAYVAGR